MGFPSSRLKTAFTGNSSHTEKESRMRLSACCSPATETGRWFGPTSFDRLLGALMALPLVGAIGQGQSVLYTLESESPYAHFGWSISGVGDFDGDGLDDFVVGSPDYGIGTKTGRVDVFSGNGSTLYRLVGDSSLDVLGSSVSGAGDVNGDGFGDFIVGAPLDSAGIPMSGSARVIAGPTGAILYTIYGTIAGEQLGRSVSGAGDVNADGFDDFIVGTPIFDPVNLFGSARVHSGLDGSLLYSYVGTAPSELLGSSVSGAGDVNGDGHDDFIIGAPGEYGSAAGAGSATVYSGIDGAVLYSFAGSAITDHLGGLAEDMGDVNADGRPDFSICADPLSRIYSGLDGSILHEHIGYGGVHPAGDVNADGFDDFIAWDLGVLNVYSGQSGAPLPIYSALLAWGYIAEGVGDTNGDGFDDYAIGNHLFGLEEEGIVFVVGGGIEPVTAYCFGDAPSVGCFCGNLASPGEGCVNSTGVGAVLAYSGAPILSSDNFQLVITSAPASKPGLILQGNTQVNGGLGNPVGGGLLCVGGQTSRSQVQMTSASGGAVFTNFLGQPFGVTGFGAGQPTDYQFWYRDTVGPCGRFNFTNALEVVWQP